MGTGRLGRGHRGGAGQGTRGAGATQGGGGTAGRKKRALTGRPHALVREGGGGRDCWAWWAELAN
jgi:hypothetical protein